MDITALQNRLNQVFQQKKLEADESQLPAQIIAEEFVEGGSLDGKELIGILEEEYVRHKEIINNDVFTKYSSKALEQAGTGIRQLVFTCEKGKHEYISFRLSQILNDRKDGVDFTEI